MAEISQWNGKNGDCETEDITTLTLKNINWRYRGEGNANLVIALPREKIILRMQKYDYGSVLDPLTINEWETKMKKSVTFYKKVMVPLLGSEFILPPDLARLSEDEIEDIDKVLLKFRPSFRLSKGIRLGLVTVQPDYTLLPPRKSYKSLINAHDASYLISHFEENTFCVEIKPKQGWVPPNDRRHTKCTFCLKQYLKLKKKRTTCKSAYCPLDLFSGEQTRMRRALEGLLETPQNNLKIFHNGNVLYGEGSNTDLENVLGLFFNVHSPVNLKSLLDRWCGLVLDALLREFDRERNSPIFFDNKTNYSLQGDVFTRDSPVEGSCDWSSEPLPSNCILHRVLFIQKLQQVDFNAVYSLYQEQSLCRGDYSYVDGLSLNNQLDEIQRYLLSATAKDCSIFIAIQKCDSSLHENSPFYIKDVEGVTYRLNIGISDIDPKPLSCIGKHHKRDEEVISASLST